MVLACKGGRQRGREVGRDDHVGQSERARVKAPLKEFARDAVLIPHVIILDAFERELFPANVTDDRSTVSVFNVLFPKVSDGIIATGEFLAALEADGAAIFRDGQVRTLLLQGVLLLGTTTAALPCNSNVKQT